ncbi:MAG: hypothetical protein LBS53_09240 [Synergistaceae bacterium]|jgi:hypothetical protein|nr:hypothetical protein [Synergistaceae bacterium]
MSKQDPSNLPAIFGDVDVSAGVGGPFRRLLAEIDQSDLDKVAEVQVEAEFGVMVKRVVVRAIPKKS